MVNRVFLVVLGVVVFLAVSTTLYGVLTRESDTTRSDTEAAGDVVELSREEFVLTQAEWEDELSSHGMDMTIEQGLDSLGSSICQSTESAEQFALRLHAIEGQVPEWFSGLAVRRFCPEDGEVAAAGVELLARRSGDQIWCEGIVSVNGVGFPKDEVQLSMALCR